MEKCEVQGNCYVRSKDFILTLYKYFQLDPLTTILTWFGILASLNFIYFLAKNITNLRFLSCCVVIDSVPCERKKLFFSFVASQPISMEVKLLLQLSPKFTVFGSPAQSNLLLASAIMFIVAQFIIVEVWHSAAKLYALIAKGDRGRNLKLLWMVFATRRQL